MKKILKWTGIGLGALVVLVLLSGVALYPSGKRKFNRSYANIQVKSPGIPSGAEAVKRGQHVAVIWGCGKCHGENLGGMRLADDPFLGSINAPNLTSGKGGVGSSYTDADWARAIRHGVKQDGRVEIFMYSYYADLSDGDLGALIAYLKQLPPVDAAFPGSRVGPLVAIAPALGLFVPAAEQIDHNAARPAEPVPGATPEYGKYLSVLCAECHGTRLPAMLKGWSQADFARALHTGVLPDGSQINKTMTASAFRELDDVELAALWFYFTGATP